MLEDYFSINADTRPGIKQTKKTNKKQTPQEIANKSLLIKLYQERVSSGRDIWTGEVISNLKDRFK